MATCDQNVVAYLELLKMPYTGCNPRGLLLGRDKALSKKLLAYHRIPSPEFAVVARGRPLRRPKRLSFPLIVKSLTQDASIGISQASVVENDDKLAGAGAFIHESIGTDAIVERYIEGRELYVGILGNQPLQVLPVWELRFDEHARGRRADRDRAAEVEPDLPEEVRHRERPGARPAGGPGAADPALCKRVYRTLGLSGYARIDLRLAEPGRLYVHRGEPQSRRSRAARTSPTPPERPA